MTISQLSTSIGFSIIFPFLPFYVRELGTASDFSTEFLAGLVFSSQALAMAAASPFWGILADRFGRKPMVVRAIFGGSITIFLMGLARSAEELIFLRVLQGLLSGVISSTMALVASVAPRGKTGFSMGILQLGMWTGVSSGPLLGGILADNYGYRIPFFVTAALLAFTGALVLILVKEPFTRAPAPSGRFHFLRDWHRILKSPGLSTTLALRFLNSVGTTAILPILPLYIEQLLGSGQQTGTYTGLVAGASSIAGTLSAVMLGRLGDRSGHKRIVLFTSLGAALFFIAQMFVSAPWQLLMLQIFAGATIGGLLPSLTALLAIYSKSSELGSVYGLDNSTVSAGRAAAPLLGAAVALQFGLRGTFAFTGLVFLLLAVLATGLLGTGRGLDSSSGGHAD